jgi:hypothetical protein
MPLAFVNVMPAGPLQDAEGCVGSGLGGISTPTLGIGDPDWSPLSATTKILIAPGIVLPAGPVIVEPGIGVVICISGCAPEPVPPEKLDSETVSMKFALLDGLVAVIVDCTNDIPMEPLVVALKFVLARPFASVTLVISTRVPLLAGVEVQWMATPDTGFPEASVA